MCKYSKCAGIIFPKSDYAGLPAWHGVVQRRAVVWITVHTPGMVASKMADFDATLPR